MGYQRELVSPNIAHKSDSYEFFQRKLLVASGKFLENKSLFSLDQ